MYDPKYDKLADVLVNYSTGVKSGESVLIEGTDVPTDMVIAIIRAVHKVCAIPIVSLKSERILRELIMGSVPETVIRSGVFDASLIEQIDIYIGIHGSENQTELSDVPPQKMYLYRKHWVYPFHEARAKRTRWVCMRWPSKSMAQQASMSTDAFEEFFFDVCTLDYQKMETAAIPLKRLMEKTDEVRIKGPGTDLRFSKKGLPAVLGSGKMNLPDGECYTAPVRTSVNGVVKFNVPILYQGTILRDVHLRFENGKIVEWSADRPESFKGIILHDSGAQYLGEFALGFNPRITSPLMNTLFDEKIAGSFHLALGRAYQEVDNGNRSMIHWDMIAIQTQNYGGGEIFFDGVLIRKDGMFTLQELQCLNP